MAVWGGLTNSCEKKRSEKPRRVCRSHQRAWNVYYGQGNKDTNVDQVPAGPPAEPQGPISKVLKHRPRDVLPGLFQKGFCFQDKVFLQCFSRPTTLGLVYHYPHLHLHTSCLQRWARAPQAIQRSPERQQSLDIQSKPTVFHSSSMIWFPRIQSWLINMSSCGFSEDSCPGDQFCFYFENPDPNHLFYTSLSALLCQDPTIYLVVTSP